MSDIEARKAHFLARIAGLSVRIDGIDSDAPDFGLPDAVGGTPIRLELRLVDAALDLIDRGHYGICRRCGQQIEDRRLDKAPWTDICAACAQAEAVPVGGRAR